METGFFISRLSTSFIYHHELDPGKKFNYIINLLKYKCVVPDVKMYYLIKYLTRLWCHIWFYVTENPIYYILYFSISQCISSIREVNFQNNTFKNFLNIWKLLFKVKLRMVLCCFKTKHQMYTSFNSNFSRYFEKKMICKNWKMT